MKKALLVILGIILMAGVASAALPAYESITVADTAIGFTASVYNSGPTRTVYCTLETAQIRIRMDGTDPTSSEGSIVEVGQAICIGMCLPSDGLASLEAITKFRAIRTGTSSGTLKCSFE